MAKFRLVLVYGDPEEVEAYDFATSDAWIDFHSSDKDVVLRVRAGDVKRIERTSD